VAELRAKLRERDKILGTLIVQAAAAGSREELAAAKASETPATHAVEVLDQRLFGGVLNAPGVKGMEDAVNVALRDVPSTVKATVACSTELCRVSLDGPEKDLERASGHVLERMPKKFAGSILLPEGDGHRALFAATRQELLATADRSEAAQAATDTADAK
jgi:hypothetical protein